MLLIIIKYLDSDWDLVHLYYFIPLLLMCDSCGCGMWVLIHSAISESMWVRAQQKSSSTSEQVAAVGALVDREDLLQKSPIRAIVR